MGSYELTVVLSGEATAAKKKQIKEYVQKLVSAGKGRVSRSDDWGKVELACPIQGETAGCFLHFALELGAEFADNISGKLNFKEEILRYLLVKADAGKK
jgi:ribosomal protein S6